jgi:hypothetical protein
MGKGESQAGEKAEVRPARFSAGRRGPRRPPRIRSLPALDSRLLALDRLGRLDHRAAHVMSAVGADDVRHHHRATLGAGMQLLGLQRVVRTPLAGPGIGMLALGKGHGRKPAVRGAARVF